MERKKFLKSLSAIGLIAISPLANSCNKSDILGGSGTDTGTGNTSGDCEVSPVETEGPFPTKMPSSLGYR